MAEKNLQGSGNETLDMFKNSLTMTVNILFSEIALERILS